MSVTFQDLQDEHNKLNGMRVSDPLELRVLFDALKHREPFLFELHSDEGSTLTIGLGMELACVQHTGVGGDPPYLIALNQSAADDGGLVEFLAGGTPTPIPRNYCFPISEIEAIAVEFLTNGSKRPVAVWEEV
jgi:hypothetical protein